MKRVIATLLQLLVIALGYVTAAEPAVLVATDLSTITAMEYYWDSDAATSFTAADGDWGSALEHAINSSASTPTTAGAHTLNIRSQNALGDWSAVRSVSVYVENDASFNIKTALATTTAMEFYWDSESATSFTAADGNWGSALENAVNSSASTPTTAGAHTLNIRSQNALGVWSEVRSVSVYVENDASFNIKTALATTTAMEFYWDSESATSFTAADGNWGSALENAVNSSASTPTTAGAHTLNIRSQNALGVWSEVRSVSVYVESDASFNIKTALATTIGMEFYWDSESATSFSADDGNWGSALENAVNSSASTPTTAGAHTLNIRSQNALGEWSEVRSVSVYVESDASFNIKTALATTTAMEFYWDSESATSFSAADGNWGSALENAVNSSASTPTTAGAHTLNIRSQNALGEWSEVRSVSVYVESDASFNIKTALATTTAMEFYWDTESATSFSADDGNWGSALENAVNSSASTPTETGAHTLNIRSQNALGEWSEVRSVSIYVEKSATFDIKTALSTIAAMEFFWDESEPVSFTAADGNWGSALENAVNSSASTPTETGAHTLNVRSQNVLGEWSVVRSVSVYVEESATFDVKTALAGITSMTFHWDDSEADAVAFSAADGNWGSALENAVNSSASTPTTAGAHTLNVRSQNVLGEWSTARSIPVYVEASETFDIQTALDAVTSMEYYWDSNAPTAFSAVDGNWGSALENAIKESASTPTTTGAHTLNIRSQNLLGEWSIVRSVSVYVEESATFDIAIKTLEVVTFEYFLGEDPGEGVATQTQELHFTQGINRADVALTVPTDQLVRGVNFGGFRVKDHNGNWSVTRAFSLLVEPDSPPYAPVVAGADSICFSTAADNSYTLKPEYQAIYEWFAVGGTISSSTNTTAVVDWDTLASVHELKAVGTNSYGAGDTTTYEVFVEETPVFTIASNGNYLAVQDDPRWSYQWTRNGIELTEQADNSYYWVTETGYYRVIVTTQCGDIIESNRVAVTYDPNQQYPKESQTITWGDLADTMNYGSSDFAILATATSGLDVTIISSDSAVVNLEGSTAKIVGAGTASISVSQSGNFKYAPALIVTQDIVVSPKALGYSAVSVADRSYNGTTSAVLTGGVISGVVTGDDVTVTTEAQFDTKDAGTGKAVTVTMTLSGTDSANYSIEAPEGITAAVTAAPLTIVANDMSKHVGEIDPELTVMFSGFVTGEDSSVLSGLAVNRESGDSVGTYAITPSGATSANYTVTFVNGVFTIANEAPVLTEMTAQTINEGSSLELLLSMSDAVDSDGDALTFVIAAGSNYTVSNDSITPAKTFTGTLTIPVRVTDGYDTTEAVNLTLTVNALSVTQTIALYTGWNMISFNVRAEDMSPESIFSGISGMVIVKDDMGKNYNPKLGFDAIDTLESTKGYKLYMTEPDTLTVKGNVINPLATTIQLEAGWNMISYLSTVDTDATTAFAGIKDKVTIVKDDEGRFYKPSIGLDGIGTMQLGKGYMLYVTEPIHFTYPNK